jgi:glyoxylase-like metal-dependent hydrolase (beta-lactamase superfamily II)
VLANLALKATLNIPTCMHVEDSGFFSNSPEIRNLERQTGLSVDTMANRLISDEERIQLGAAVLRVLHTPGHTPGSCCFQVAGHLFTGVPLFVGDAGRTDLKGGSLERLIWSIETKLLGLAITPASGLATSTETAPTAPWAVKKRRTPISPILSSTLDAGPPGLKRQEMRRLP